MADVPAWIKGWFPDAKPPTPAAPSADSPEERVDTGEAAQGAELAQPAIESPWQAKEGKIVDWEWSPVSSLGSLIAGVGIGALSPKEIQKARSATKEDIKTRYATQHPVWSAVTDVAEAVSGAGQVAGAVLLPSPVEQVRRPVETTPIPPEVTEKFPTFMQGWMKDWDQTPGYKDIETDKQAYRALKTGVALGSGAIGGTVGLGESLVDPDTTLETLSARPFTVGTTLLPVAKALRKGVQSFRGVKPAPVETPGTTPPASEAGIEGLPDATPVEQAVKQVAPVQVGAPAVSVWQGIKDVVGDKAKGAWDTYKQAFVDGFESGDPRATALAQQIATAPERAVDLINDWAGQIGRASLEAGKRAGVDAGIDPRAPIPTLERPRNIPIPPLDDLGVREAPYIQELINNTIEADKKNRQNIRKALGLAEARAEQWTITPEGGVVVVDPLASAPQLSLGLLDQPQVNPLPRRPMMTPMGGAPMEPGVKAQTYSAKVRSAIDQAVGDLSDQLNIDPSTIRKMVEHEVGKVLSDDVTSVLRDDPKGVGKALIAQAERQINRTLNTAEKRAYLEKLLDPSWVGDSYSAPEFFFTGKKLPNGVQTGGQVFAHVDALIPDKNIPRAVAQATAKAMEDLTRSQMPERLAAEAGRVAKATDTAVDRVKGILAQIQKLDVTDVDPKMAQWIAGLDKSLKEGNLLNQVIPYDPALVSSTLRALYPVEGAREAGRIAQALGEYKPKDGVWMQPLFERAIALHTMEPVGPNALTRLTQHMKGSATARNIASGATNVLGNAGFGSIRRGVPATVLFGKGLQLLRETGDYLNGGEVRPELRQALSDLAGTGALTNDFLREIKGKAKSLDVLHEDNFWTGKGGVTRNVLEGGWDLYNKGLEKFYEMGDKPFRLEESIAHWENYRKALGKLADGEEITLDQGRRHPRIRKDGLGYSMADDMAPNVADRGWKPLTEQQLGREIGKAAAHRGTALTLNYGDIPGWAKLVRNLPDAGVLSSFASWASLALDVPGRKGHWAKALDGNPFDIPSTSKAVLRDSAIESAGLALRRAAMASAAEQGIIQHGQADILFEKLNSRDRTSLAHQLSDPSLYSGLDLGGWAATGPTGALVRLGGWLYKNAQGWDASTPDLTPQQRDLVYRAESGQLGGMKDALGLVNIGGSILADTLGNVIDAWGDPTKEYGWTEGAKDILPLFTGVTTAKILQGAAGYLADPQASLHPRLEDLVVALAGAGSPEEKTEVLRNYSQTQQSLLKFSGRKGESESGVADPVGLWIARGIFGKAWQAKSVLEASPAAKGSFLQRAVKAMKAGAGVESEAAHKARIERAALAVEASTDPTEKANRMAVLDSYLKRQIRDYEIETAIDQAAMETWQKFLILSEKLGVK